MVVKKTKGGYSVVHCHGKKKGQIIKTFRTKRAANRMHRAIQANKKK
jgi:hypothetical protein